MQCPVCQRGFSCRDNVLRHHRNVHGGGSRIGGGGESGEGGGGERRRGGESGGEGRSGGRGEGKNYRSEILSLSSSVHGKHYRIDRLWKDVFPQSAATKLSDQDGATAAENRLVAQEIATPLR